MESTSPYSFTFTLSEPDILDAIVEMTRFTAAGKAQRKKYRKIAHHSWLVAAACGALGLALFVMPMVSSTWKVSAEGGMFFIVSAAVMALLGAFVWNSTTVRGIRRGAIRQARSVAFTVARQPHTISMSPSGFRFDGEGFLSHMAWRHYAEVVAGDRFIFFPRHDATANVLPRSIAGSPEHIAAIVRDCRQWLADDGGGAAYAIPSLVQGRDVKCTRCNYNLRDLTQTRCPECGHELDPIELFEQVTGNRKRRGK